MNPVTTSCPFLPGQKVNLLEVPIQIKEQDNFTSDALPPVFTLDPQDKFRSLGSQVSESHQGSAINQNHSLLRCDVRPSTCENRTETDSILGIFSSSALSDSPIEADHVSICTEPALHGSDWYPHLPAGRPFTTGSFAWGDCFNHFAYLDNDWSCRGTYSVCLLENLAKLGLERTPVRRMCEERACVETKITRDDTSESNLGVVAPKHRTSCDPETSAQDRRAEASVHGANINVLRSVSSQNCSSLLHKSSVWTRSRGECQDHSLKADCNILRAKSDTSHLNQSTSLCGLQHSASVSSVRTSGLWSALTLGSANDNVHPLHHSRPLTPSLSTLNDLTFQPPANESLTEFDESPKPQLDGGFLGYNLPEADYSSALTIRNLENANSCTPGSGVLPCARIHRHQLVEAWNDGSDHRGTATQELVDDLGYLGSLIA